MWQANFDIYFFAACRKFRPGKGYWVPDDFADVTRGLEREPFACLPLENIIHCEALHMRLNCANSDWKFLKDLAEKMEDMDFPALMARPPNLPTRDPAAPFVCIAQR